MGGSTSTNSYDTTIGKLDANSRWSRAGDLSVGRNGHNVIYDGEYLIVVGGYAGADTSLMTEKCTVGTAGVTCTGQNPSLYDYKFYPELFMVPANFCKSLR